MVKPHMVRWGKHSSSQGSGCPAHTGDIAGAVPGISTGSGTKNKPQEGPRTHRTSGQLLRLPGPPTLGRFILVFTQQIPVEPFSASPYPPGQALSWVSGRGGPLYLVLELGLDRTA